MSSIEITNSLLAHLVTSTMPLFVVEVLKKNTFVSKCQEYEKLWNVSVMCQKKYMENCIHEQWHSNNLESVPMRIVFYLVPMVGGVYIGRFEIGLAIVDGVN